MISGKTFSYKSILLKMNQQFFGVVLLLLLCLPSTFTQTEKQTKQKKGNLKGLSVCTAHFEPLVKCEEGKEPSGYHIELFKLSAANVGLTDYTIKCMQFGEMMDHLLNGGEECDMGVGGITITTERLKNGLHFSFPTYRGSLGILVKGFVNEGSTWSFLKPLHWTVWVAVGITSLIIPCIVFFIETLSCHGFIHPRDLSNGMKQAIWDSLVTLLNFGNFTVQSQEARIIVVGYGFLVLILINTYVANLAAFLTITNIESSIKSISDLLGKRVMAGGVYENRLRKQNIHVERPFDSATKYKAVDEFKKPGSNFDAVIYDEPWMTHVAGEDCTLFVLSETVSPFDYGFVFPSNSKDLTDQFSGVLVSLQENGTMTDLLESYVTIQLRDCPADEEVSETQAVHFKHMVGLWIILAACIAVSVSALSLKWLRRIRKAKAIQMSQVLPRCKTIIETVYHPHAVEKRCQIQGSKQIPSPSTGSSIDIASRTLGTSEEDFGSFQGRVHEQLRELRKDMQVLLERIECAESPNILTGEG